MTNPFTTTATDLAQGHMAMVIQFCCVVTKASTSPHLSPDNNDHRPTTAYLVAFVCWSPKKMVPLKRPSGFLSAWKCWFVSTRRSQHRSHSDVDGKLRQEGTHAHVSQSLIRASHPTRCRWCKSSPHVSKREQNKNSLSCHNSFTSARCVLNCQTEQ